MAVGGHGTCPWLKALQLPGYEHEQYPVHHRPMASLSRWFLLSIPVTLHACVSTLVGLNADFSVQHLPKVPCSPV